ncbi:MAG: hypothetical protein AAGF79_17015 [Pseudomonadota bacterium]
MAIVLSFGASEAAAADFLSSRGGARTYQINNNVFEVVGNSGRGFDIWWCGASTYARRVLGAGWQTPITISRTLGRSEATGRISSVQFTLNPGALGISTLQSMSPNALEVGDTKTVQDANNSCQNLRIPRR